MKIAKIPKVVAYLLLLTLLFTQNIPSQAQWVQKALALKKRSEVSSVVYKNKLYCFIGFGNSLLEVEPSSEVYDPATNTWSLLASMPAGKTVTHQGVALIDNTVWHVGGRVGKNPGPLTSEIWIYNITTNTWSQGPQLKDPTTGNPLLWAGGGAALVGRTLHVFGGFVNNACNNDQDKYHLTLNVDSWLANPAASPQWQNNRKVMPVKRNHFSTTVLHGKIYVLGGQFGHDCGGGQDKQYSHVYDPIADSWTELTTMPAPRSHAEGGIFPLDGKIYLVAGQGSNGASTNKVTIFNPEANNGLGSWTDDVSMVLPNGYEGASAKVVNSTFIVSHGGIGASSNPTNLTYSRSITRNIAYKLGFTASCLDLKASTPSTINAKNLLYTTEGTKNYTATSNVGWLTVTKNTSGTALGSGVEIEVTVNTTGLAAGKYTGMITATPGGSGPAYSAATFCVNLTVEGSGTVTNAVRINSGGAAFTASNSRQFAADSYFSGTTSTFSNSGGDILNTTDDALYYTERFAPSFAYNIPVTNGSYNVVLHFAEIWFGAPGGGAGGAGKRMFHVDIEGSRKLTNYDIFAAAGGAMKAVQVSLPVNVSDGTLNINFLTGTANMPKVSAIEVLPSSGSLARARIESSHKGGEDFDLYPNPSAGRFTVNYYSSSRQQATIRMLNARSSLVLQKTITLESGQNLIVLDTEKMTAGLYFVQLTSGKNTLVKKLVITN